ncbi:HAD family hydrolase [Tessaracoccus antarcticus]|uniref:HAD family hydrolase n=1 Tax=Tessaracoccus antarcticus TaxID=2479848 RepID=A0A3M0G9Z5_9ACTN|nr:HAD-IA family hydrolase [Tessaracoccus antarcticus]RMB61714.1 HAD family hydrolase [Tessaracoccus antarcticus]
MTPQPHNPLVGASFDAVIFDLDGTLIDSHVAMVRSYERWAEEFGIRLDRLPHLLGMPSAAVSEALLPPEHVVAATERIEVLEVTDTEGVVALPGAREAFTTLPRTGVAIATSCTTDLMRARLSAADLPFPDVIVTRDHVADGKPAPDSFLLAAKLLGVHPARALVVEDAPAGIAAARAAGCPVLGIASTKRHDELAADAVVGDLSQVEWQVETNGQISLRLRTA